MDEAALVLRVVIGVVMAFHGTEKLFGWWGSDGIDGAERFFTKMGFRPPRLMAYVAGLTETSAGVLLVAGAATQLAVAMLVGTLVNVVAVHARNGLSRTKNGFEYELVILAGVTAVALIGPGSFSVDAAVGVPDPTWVTWLALGLGAGMGLLVVATRDRSASPMPTNSAAAGSIATGATHAEAGAAPHSSAPSATRTAQ